MTTDTKDLVLTCLEFYGKGDLEAVATLLREDYVDHGLPFGTATKADWIAKARELPLAGMRVDIRRLVAEGDYVTMFSRRWLPVGEGGVALDIAVADVFRLEGGLIAERWEVVEPIPADAPNPVATL
ncbi:ester cyclase [Streptomyces cocklensis]|jgi:predicted SnoaL-like aldol condensation-catalyzing enzyme|uniref:SnoaL-like domain-containing protein n=1 Tax=Actinacidiphila cocklensis TaxID=887465 RepID=A0A9W4DK31_9ACTN|nr:nuclear transport factor 2 family protein [Actinacidiphila cocklensis]MDD1059592.1 ester cyclase [Actinacidiphila cocklensis]CAG6392866.1 SnoaL-like domain-containing protein [Actinacidiphila cocklensis]